MKFTFDTLIQIRTNSWKAIEHLSIEQLHTIPNGFSNNIIWNLGHMVATQQILCYKLAGATPLLPEDFLAMYRKDTSPKSWTQQADISQIKEYYTLSNASFEKDYHDGKLAHYKEYKTSAGVTLATIEDALVYNYGHENLHYGVILSLRKLV